MSFMHTLREKLWPSNSVYVERSDWLLGHVSAIEGTLGEMRQEQEQLRASVNALNGQLQRLTSMQEYCSGLLRTQTGGAILLAGWYGADNLGDELMLRTLLDYASEEVRRRLWVLIWQNADYDFEYLNELGVRTVRYPRSTEEASLLADGFDAIVWGGGAILDDNQYDENPANTNTGNLFIRLNRYLMARGKRVFAIGLSTNWQLSKPAYVVRLAQIVQAAESFSVRDELSLEVLDKAGINTDRISVCPDIVFGNRQLKELDNVAPKDYVLGFVPMYIGDMRETNKLILEAALRKIGEMPAGANARVRLIPFYRPDDAPCLNWLRDTCSRPDLVDIAPYSPEISQTPLLGCSAAICSRYHAALVAGTLGVPFLCVYPDMHVHYKNKCIYLSQIFGCADAFIPATAVTKDDISSFVGGNRVPTTQSHQFFEEATEAITALFECL